MISGITKLPPISMLEELVIISKYKILLISKHYEKDLGVNYNALFFR